MLPCKLNTKFLNFKNHINSTIDIIYNRNPTATGYCLGVEALFDKFPLLEISNSRSGGSAPVK
jgi:hypothetical protein